ncbi:MAG: hypothetical protein K9G13_03665 [Aquiluna sp.]|nr:hypothetical protein [Aquiluna sp.]MCF8545617.1 hypothetical protein [Aquiluna sp.]
MQPQSNRDAAWTKAIDELNLKDLVSRHGYAEVDASALKKFGEPRLLAKMDSLSDIPPVLRQLGWSVFAVTNSKYLIGELDLHFRLPSGAPLETSFTWNNPFQSLSPETVNGESQAALLALHSGILEDFLGAKFSLTNFGRMRTDAYDLTLNVRDEPQQIRVSGVQFELDAGFESSEAIALLEVKAVPTESLNLRQIYFPFRHWVDRTTKLVIPIFGVWSNKSFELHRMNFSLIDDINSMEIIESRVYRFSNGAMSVGLLEVAAAKAAMHSDSTSYPFPQADDASKLVQILESMPKQFAIHDVAKEFNFDERQAAYYVNALGFLGVIRRKDTGWSVVEPERPLNSFGGARSWSEVLIYRMLDIPPLASVFLQGNSFSRGNFSMEVARRSLRDSSWGADLGESTQTRRARTIVSWCKWIDSQLGN